MPKAAIIKFDDSKTGRLARQSSKIPLHSYDNGIPILPFEAKEHVGRSETSPKVTRIQLPIVLCWACTYHKLQGATLDKVVMSFQKLRTKRYGIRGFQPCNFTSRYIPSGLKCKGN